SCTGQCSTCRASTWRRRSASSCASRRPTRASTARGRSSSWPGLTRPRSWRCRTDGRSQKTEVRMRPRGAMAMTRCDGRRLVFCLLSSVFCLLPAACQQKMAAQPSYKPLDASSFFDDGQSARPVVPGTVARGHLRTDLALFTGKRSGESRNWLRPAAAVGMGTQGVLGVMAVAAAEQNDYVDTFPLPVTREFVRHGHDRFMIYCVVCHDPLGTGRGKIVERGYTRPPSFHIERLRQAPVGHFFGVITNGYGSMPEYRAQVPPRDRWAIVAYIRALQQSQHASLEDVPEEERAKIHDGGQRP